jgi:hypothetical protein
VAQGRPTYDWDRLFDGEVHTLRRGKDFDVSALNVRTAAYAAAKARGCKVTTKELDADTVELQAHSFPTDDEEGTV